LYGDSQRVAHVAGLAGYSLPEGFAFDIFCGDEVDGVGLADLEDGDDIRMIQSRRGARLLLKAPQAFGVPGEVSWQQLQGNATAQPRILREVNFAHAAAPDKLDHLVRPDGSARDDIILFAG